MAGAVCACVLSAVRAKSCPGCLPSAVGWCWRALGYLGKRFAGGEAADQRNGQRFAVGNPGLWHNYTTQLQHLKNPM